MRLLLVAFLFAISYAQTVLKGTICIGQDFLDNQISETKIFDYSRGWTVETTYCPTGYCLGPGITRLQEHVCGTFHDLGNGCSSDDDCLSGLPRSDVYWHVCHEGQCKIADGAVCSGSDPTYAHEGADGSGSFAANDGGPYGAAYGGCKSGWCLSTEIMRGEAVCGSIGPFGDNCVSDTDCVKIAGGGWPTQLMCKNDECVMPYGRDGWCGDIMAQLYCDGFCYKAQKTKEKTGVCLETMRRVDKVVEGKKCNSVMKVNNPSTVLMWVSAEKAALRIPDDGFLSCRTAWGETVCVYTADCPESGRVAASRFGWQIYEAVTETCGDDVCSAWESDTGSCERDCGVCKIWCERNSSNWGNKCLWPNCQGCVQCSET